MEASWIKLSILFIVFMLPIWIFNFVDLSMKWKLLFTLAVAIGLYAKFGMGLNLRERH